MQGDPQADQPLAHAVQHPAGDGADLFPLQLAEHDGVIQTVEEFRPEDPLQVAHHGLLELGQGAGLPGGEGRLEAQLAALGGDAGGPHVGGHDDDVLRKSAFRPWVSVTTPSSVIWRRRPQTSSWAFSSSSKRRTE